MKFLIGAASPEQISFGGTEGLFEATNGKFYNFEIKYTEDEGITITDSVGRYVPLDLEDIKPLAEVTSRISRFQDTSTAVRALLINELAYGENIVA